MLGLPLHGTQDCKARQTSCFPGASSISEGCASPLLRGLGVPHRGDFIPVPLPATPRLTGAAVGEAILSFLEGHRQAPPQSGQLCRVRVWSQTATEVALLGPVSGHAGTGGLGGGTDEVPPLSLCADLKQMSVLDGVGPILQVRTLRLKQPLTAHDRWNPALSCCLPGFLSASPVSLHCCLQACMQGSSLHHIGFLKR